MTRIALTSTVPAAWPAAATLVVDVTRGAHADETIWTFSGSATATRAGRFIKDNALPFFNEHRAEVGIFTDLDLFSLVRHGGSVIGDAGGAIQRPDASPNGLGFSSLQLLDLNTVFVDSEFGTAPNEIAFGVAGAQDLAFAAGDEIRWQGALTVTALGFDARTQGGITTTLQGTAPFSFEISIDLAPVPDPAGPPLLAGAFGVGALGIGALGIGALGVGAWAARRKRHAS